MNLTIAPRTMTSLAPREIRLEDLAGLPRERLVLGYLGFWLTVALSLSLSSLSQYEQDGGHRYWEPFLWEISSAAVVATLAILVFGLVFLLSSRPRPLAIVVAAHLVAAFGFAGAHIVGMYSIRYAVYATVGLSYRAGAVPNVVAFESLKDLVTYTFLASVSYGALYFLRERIQRREVVQLQSEVTAARLALLQSQLNPHFLFNTLNLISSVLRPNPDLADQILERLANLLRATLRVGELPTHSLGEEVAVLRPYLDIMSARFGDRLHLDIDIDPRVLGNEVPTLLLIPIVENAIQHAGSGEHVSNTVRIAAQRNSTGLHISVSNNTGVLEASSRDGGIGLANSRERLWRLYRENARIDLVALPIEGVQVSIELPDRAAPGKP